MSVLAPESLTPFLAIFKMTPIKIFSEQPFRFQYFALSLRHEATARDMDKVQKQRSNIVLYREKKGR